MRVDAPTAHVTRHAVERRPGKAEAPAPAPSSSPAPAEASATAPAPGPSGLARSLDDTHRSPVAVLRLLANHPELRGTVEAPTEARGHGRGFEKALAAYRSAIGTVAEPPPMTEEPPAVEPPVVEPPVVELPVFEPPVVEAPVVESPVLEPPVVEPPAAEDPPPATEEPAA